MTAAEFRRLALALPGAEEGAHQGHADFRVAGKIFATLGHPGPEWGTVKLSTDEQRLRIEAAPDVYEPVSGGWGRQGATKLRLDAADEATASGALRAAWRERASARQLKTTALGRA